MTYMNKKNVTDEFVEMTEDQAIASQWKFFEEWTPRRDTLPLRFGCSIGSIIAAFSGIMINNHYRRKLSLGKVGIISSYLPATMLPSMITMYYHRRDISTDIIINRTKCPVCLETRAMVYQFLIAIVYPLILSPVTGYMLASRYYTCRIPMLVYEPRKLWQFHKNISRPLYKKIPIYAFINILSLGFITYLEQQSYYTVMGKFNEFIKKLEAENNNV